MEGVSTLLNFNRSPASTLHLTFEVQQVTFASEHHIWGEAWKVGANAVPKQAAMELFQIFYQFFPKPARSSIGHAMIVLQFARSRLGTSLPVLDNFFGKREIGSQTPVDVVQVGSRCKAELLLAFSACLDFSQIKKMHVGLKAVRTDRFIWPSNLIQTSFAVRL